ncbi:MAG: heparinase, partial [Sphingomonas sp.]|nr:heparinase [Sphingomonas sp.]
MSADAAAQSAVVRKLAKGPLMARLFGSGRQPLKLVAVPRDHVQGDRRRGEALLAGRFVLGSESVALADLEFAALGTSGAVAERLQSFAWLRDLA